MSDTTPSADLQRTGEATRLSREKSSALGEIWAFMRVRKKLWLAPIVIVLFVLALLIWVGASAGVLSPFIYAM